MIQDSPYRNDARALPATAGLAIGLAAGAAMAFFAARMGNVSWPVQLITGGAAGLLYALCQVALPPHRLLAVGLFYGLLLWILVGQVTSRLVGVESLRPWQDAASCLIFGLCLGVVACVTSRRASAATITPRD